MTMEETARALAGLRGYAAESAAVSWHYVDHITTAQLEEILGAACEARAPPKIIVLYNTINVQAKRLAFLKTLADFELFEHRRLKLLLGGHRLIPRHSRLSPADRAAIVARYGELSLPSLCLGDPMAQLHDFREGDVIKIDRLDGTVYYRRVVEE